MREKPETQNKTEVDSVIGEGSKEGKNRDGRVEN